MTSRWRWRVLWQSLFTVLVLAGSVSLVQADTSLQCPDQPNFICATAADEVTGPLNLLGASPLTLEGATADAFETAVAVTDPTADRTFTIPNADSAAAQAVTCSGGQHVSAFNAGTGAFTCSADSGGTPAWSTLTNPAANLALSMSNYTTVWTWGTATGAGTAMLELVDGTSNTGTGALLNLHTASGSAARPFQATAQGTANGVYMATNGDLGSLGTGRIYADRVKVGGLQNALVWQESCTASPCTLAAGTPRTADTALVVYHGVVWRRVASCGGVNEYTLSGNTVTKCASGQTVGAAPDNMLVTYEL